MIEMFKIYFSAILFALFWVACSDNSSEESTPKPDPKPEEVIKNGSLKGTIIGTEWSVDYDNGNAISKEVNVKEDVFDGNFKTFFASY